MTGKTDIAVYRSLTGERLIRRATDLGQTLVTHGNVGQGDFPAPADFTIAGITDMVVFRPSASPPVS